MLGAIQPMMGRGLTHCLRNKEPSLALRVSVNKPPTTTFVTIHWPEALEPLRNDFEIID
jgi:hypothetical protein